MISRRRILAAVGGAILGGVGRRAEAQPAAAVHRIGYLDPGPPPRGHSRAFDAFQQGLRQHGLVEGQTVIVERRYAARGGPERVRALLAELIAARVDVIVTVTTPVALEARRATQIIPIVMAVSTDPVGGGVVRSLARPGGNVTGLALMGPELTAGRAELLKAVAPQVSRLVIVAPTGHPVWERYRKNALAAAPALGLAHVEVASIGLERGRWAEAFARLGRGPETGLLVTESPSFAREGAVMAALALEHHLPAVYGLRSHVEAGGLMSYAADVPDLYRRAAGLLARVLKGARPADLPVEQPTRFELAINHKTARALGLTIPTSLLLRADAVIE